MTAVLLPEGKVFKKDKYFELTGYYPHEGQKIVHYNSARHRVLCCGRRWGKTLLGGKEAETQGFLRNFLGEPKLGWIIGPEYTDCEKEFRVLFDSFKKLGIDQVSPKFRNNADSGDMHIKTSWGFEVLCRSAKHPDSLVGEGLDFALIVEAGRHRRKMWGDFVRPALSDKRGWSLISGVPEGASENSLLYSLFQRGQDASKLGWHSLRMPSWTNNIVFPGGRHDPEIIDAEDDLTDDEFARQYGAEFVERVGRVMAEWDDDIHIADLEYNRKWPLYSAVDFGYTNDWVWLWIQVDEWKNVYVIGEERFNLLDTEEIAKELKLHPLASKVLDVYVDPANPDDANMLRRHMGVTTKGNTGGEIKTRIALIRSALKQRPAHLPDGHPDKKPQLLVDRSCIKLAWEMRTGYRWPENRTQQKNDSEIPLDKDNHGPEALGRFFKGYVGAQALERRSKMNRVRGRRWT